MAQVHDIQTLKNEFNRTAMGRDLMQFANDNGITIEYDKSVADRGALATYSSWISTAKVNPELPMEEQVLFLAHELRHAWQDKVLKCAELEAKLVSPEERWTLRRFEEADAEAWSSYFWAERMIELNMQSFVPQNSFQEFLFAVKIRHEIEKTDNGLTLDEYRDIVVKRAFEDLGSGYNSTHLRLAGNQLTRLEGLVSGARTLVNAYEYDKADAAIKSLQAQLDAAPTRAELEKNLRQYFGTSLDSTEPTSLQSDKVTTDDIFKNFPTPGTEFFSPWSPPVASSTGDKLAALERSFQTAKKDVDYLTRLNNANRILHKGEKPATQKAPEVQKPKVSVKKGPQII